jgi:hypothetical protein
LYATVRLGGDVMFFLFFIFFIESDKGVGQLDKGYKALIDDFFFSLISSVHMGLDGLNSQS